MVIFWNLSIFWERMSNLSPTSVPNYYFPDISLRIKLLSYFFHNITQLFLHSVLFGIAYIMITASFRRMQLLTWRRNEFYLLRSGALWLYLQWWRAGEKVRESYRLWGKKKCCFWGKLENPFAIVVGQDAAFWAWQFSNVEMEEQETWRHSGGKWVAYASHLLGQSYVGFIAYSMDMRWYCPDIGSDIFLVCF